MKNLQGTRCIWLEKAKTASGGIASVAALGALNFLLI
jgi:hypothetical protein